MEQARTVVERKPRVHLAHVPAGAVPAVGRHKGDIARIGCDNPDALDLIIDLAFQNEPELINVDGNGRDWWAAAAERLGRG